MRFGFFIYLVVCGVNICYSFCNLVVIILSKIGKIFFIDVFFIVSFGEIDINKLSKKMLCVRFLELKWEMGRNGEVCILGKVFGFL